MRSYFEIAKDWENATDSEVLFMKEAIGPFIEKIHAIPLEHMKIVCGTHWYGGSLYEVFVFDDREEKGNDELNQEAPWPLLFHFDIDKTLPNTLFVSTEEGYRYYNRLVGEQ